MLKDVISVDRHQSNNNIVAYDANKDTPLRK